MADKEAGLNIGLGVTANEGSVDQALNKIEKKISSATKGGRIDITVPIDVDKSKLTKAQKELVDEISKLTSKGFSASGKDIDKLSSKFNEFTKAFDQAGKGRQNKIFREIRKQVEGLQQDYKALQKEIKSTKGYETKSTKSTRAKKPSDSAADRYLKKQEKYSKQAEGAGKRAELRKELKEVRENKSPIKSSGNIKAGSTNDHLMRLSEYSAHGSKWADELARTLKEEIAKSAKTLVTYIDPSYKKLTKDGRATTEQEFLSHTITAARDQLKKSIAQLEAGSEDITLDKLKEQAAVIKVLNKALGRTTETAEKIITGAIEGRYNGSTEIKQGKGKYQYDKTIQTKVGGTNLEEGQEKGVGPGHDNTQRLVKELYAAMHKWDSEVIADNIAKEMILGNEKTIEKMESKRKNTSNLSQANNKIQNVKTTPDYKAELAELNGRTNEVFDAVRRTNSLTQTQTVYDKNANVKQDTDAAKEIKIEQQNADINRDTAGAVKRDESTGFNTNERADELIDATKKEKETKLPDDVVSILQSILSQLMIMTGTTKSKRYRVTKKGDTKSTHTDRSFEINAAYAELEEAFEPIKKALIPLRNSVTASTEIPKALSKPEFDKISRKLAESDKSPRLQKSNIYASPIKETVWDKLEKAINDATGATKEYNKIMNATADEQDKLAAERITTYGMNNGRNPNDTGDIANMRRILQLYRTNKSSIEQNPELKQKIKLTPGREVDTTAITKELNKTLSGKQMRNAQMGGSWQRQILGAFTGFIGMPSLEKSRAQADGLNQILGNVNKALQSVLSSIQMKETELSGLEASGKAKFNEDGSLAEGSSSAAFKTLADLEEYKLVLDSILADMNVVDQVVGRTGGKFSKLVQQLSFTSPVLRDNNSILRNINAGLDKNGKALKFQTRMAEILNYTFQLISRSIGQWFKKILSMLNPLNIIKNTFRTITGWVKSAFQDFGSYDVKWQRTMNVIKINFQRAIKPAMEWIAQKLVNIIGFFNIISMKVQEAFGQIPVDLFDQAGAAAEKIRRELEEGANVTAGFDELHDIGSDNTGANDLLGDIYKPQLSKEWEDMANEIGDLFAGLIKGEKTIGEVFGRIFGMLLELLGKIAKAIWDWFKQTSLGKWLIANWKKILATILAIFIGWQLLKIAGSALFNALFGKLLEKGVITGVFSKLGGWISSGLSSLASKGGVLGFVGSFGQGIIMAFQTLFTGGKYSLLGTLKEMFTSSAAITEAGSWGSMIGFAITKALGAALAGAVVAKGFDMVADDASYNIGLKENGGKDKDQKSGLGGKLLGAAGGAALAGLVVGGPIAMGVGAIVGLLVTSLAPAIEEITTKSKDMNNELQKIEYYEGAVKGAQTQVDIFDEQLGLLKESLKLSTDKVYDQGEKLGISKTRMDELVKATQDGTFTTDMLSGSEVQLSGSLTDLAQKQEHTTEVTKKLEEAQKKLLKAQTELSIAQDVEAGNFELAAARIELAEAQGVYSTDEATKKRIQIYKQGGEEERKNLLQNLTPEQRALMAQYNGVTDKETKELVKIWQESGDDMKKAFLSGTDESVQRQFENNMNSMDNIIKQHQGFWQKAGDTIAEIFSFGNATTWTYNAEAKYEDEKKKGKFQYKKYDVGTNYVPSDGLAYLHQGEAVIPKKYNQPYQPNDNSRLESAIEQLNQQVAQIGVQVNKGIEVRGEFKQRGSDLVAVTERARNKNGSQPLNNPIFAR